MAYDPTNTSIEEDEAEMTRLWNLEKEIAAERQGVSVAMHSKVDTARQRLISDRLNPAEAIAEVSEILGLPASADSGDPREAS